MLLHAGYSDRYSFADFFQRADVSSIACPCTISVGQQFAHNREIAAYLMRVLFDGSPLAILKYSLIVNRAQNFLLY